LDTVIETLKFDSAKSLSEVVHSWNLSKHYQIKGNFIVKITQSKIWGKFKQFLKSKGKFFVGKALPIALGLATGGTGIGLALAPVIAGIIKKFQSNGIKVSKESEKDMEDAVLGRSDGAVDSLSTNLQKSNSNMGKQVQLSINEELMPIISGIHESLNFINKNQGATNQLIEDWSTEQSLLIQNQNVTMDITLEEINKIESALKKTNEISEKHILESSSVFNRTENKLNTIFERICKNSLAELSLIELLQVSRIQFQKISLAGKLSQPFDEDLFIATESLDEEFKDYLNQENQKFVFLLLAKMGMGKTWNAVHLGKIARDSKLAIPFYIPIHLGYKSILSQIFDVDSGVLVHQIGKTCKKIKENIGVNILFLFDGIDEFPDVNRQPFLNFLSQLMYNSSEDIQIILTDRIEDWCKNEQIQQFYPKVKTHIFSNPEYMESLNSLQLPTEISGYLWGFEDDQLSEAITNYELDYDAFPDNLLHLCKRPYILQLVSELQTYPNPEIIEEFLPIFFNTENPTETILYRMGIIGSVQEYFFRLIEFFGTEDAVKTDRELEQITKNGTDPSWKTILLSGLILETQEGFTKLYWFDPVFCPVVKYYLIQQNIKDYSSIVTDLTHSNLIAKSVKDIRSKVSVYALNRSEKLQILDTIYKSENLYPFVIYVKIPYVFDDIYSEFIEKLDFIPIMYRILFNSPFSDLVTPKHNTQIRAKWLRINRNWPWTTEDLEEMIDDLFKCGNDLAKRFVQSIRAEIPFDNPQTQWANQMQQLINQNLPIDTLKLKVIQGGAMERQLFMDNILSHVPPPTMDRIYIYARLFSKEMNDYFKSKYGNQLLKALIAQKNNYNINEIPEELNQRWEWIYNNYCPGKIRHILSTLKEILGVNQVIALKLYNRSIQPTIRYVDTNTGLEARDTLILNFKRVSKIVGDGAKEISENAKESYQKGKKFVKEGLSNAKNFFKRKNKKNKEE
jgi:hypothetical protein